ncbi:methyl-accepting chemotaxis protein [Microbacteriaceae bacterium K1510]|nr:methyl-accepting chemotaxis protein [Microbacteriaceae bacterium K1510]
MRLPKLSIAAKLYAIFALMATTAVALAVVAVLNSYRHTTLAHQFETANTGALNVERVNALLYAMVMESRGIYMSPDLATAKPYAADLRSYANEVGKLVEDWKASVRDDDAELFAAFSGRVATMIAFRKELARLGTEVSPTAARAWGDVDSERETRKALNRDLEKLAELYRGRAAQVYVELGTGIDRNALWLSAFAVLAVTMAIVGPFFMSRGVVRPLADITRMTQAVANGCRDPIEFQNRRDEFGALAKSVGVFQQTMRHNEELNHAVRNEGEERGRRQQEITKEIARFSAEVEASLSELGRISDQMLNASSRLATAADNASVKTSRAEEASSEASANVRDIASAADELSASVNEIDRQVAQSNAIATKAVNEAEATNAAVKELDEAAARIGDVVKLITDIAEQTNLLALNATIEAARAGEAGRGFAVVAGEVKALAGQTSRATEEIGAQIAGMQRATMRSIEAITAIEQTIREIGEISGAIAAAVTEQGAATQEIARSVDIAAKRTLETANEVNLVGSATEDTRTSANAVKAVSDDLGTIAGRIRGQVDVFFERLSA